MTLLMANRSRTSRHALGAASPGFALAAAVLGFFMITLDAVVVNVALPSIRGELGGGITGLQWVVDGYTLMFAALLLSSVIGVRQLGRVKDTRVVGQTVEGGHVRENHAAGSAVTEPVLIELRKPRPAAESLAAAIHRVRRKQ